MTAITATVPASAMHAAASLTVFAARGKDATMTPILGGVAVSVAGGTFLAVATDRYMVGEYRTELEHDADELPAVLIPSELLTTFAKQAPRFGVVTITNDDGLLTIEHASGAIRGAAVKGNIPPVSRLFPTETHPLPATTTLNMDALAVVAKVKHPEGVKPLLPRNNVWTFSGSGDTDRSPILIERTFGAEHAFRVLIQPNRPTAR